MFLFPCHSGYRNIVCYEYKHIDHFQPHNYFPAQSLHFRFGSVAPCPTLKSDVTASTPRTRYRRLAKPYLTGFSCCTQSAYKSKQSFLRSLEEISYADFSARTLNILYYSNLIFSIKYNSLTISASLLALPGNLAPNTRYNYNNIEEAGNHIDYLPYKIISIKLKLFKLGKSRFLLNKFV